MLNAELSIAAVEVTHLTRPHMRRTHGQAPGALIDARKVHEIEKRFFQRGRRIIASPVGAERIIGAKLCQRVQPEEARYSVAYCDCA